MPLVLLFHYFYQIRARLEVSCYRLNHFLLRWLVQWVFPIISVYHPFSLISLMIDGASFGKSAGQFFVTPSWLGYKPVIQLNLAGIH